MRNERLEWGRQWGGAHSAAAAAAATTTAAAAAAAAGTPPTEVPPPPFGVGPMAGLRSAGKSSEAINFRRSNSAPPARPPRSIVPHTESGSPPPDGITPRRADGGMAKALIEHAAERFDILDGCDAQSGRGDDSSAPTPPRAPRGPDSASSAAPSSPPLWATGGGGARGGGAPRPPRRSLPVWPHGTWSVTAASASACLGGASVAREQLRPCQRVSYTRDSPCSLAAAPHTAAVRAVEGLGRQRRHATDRRDRRARRPARRARERQPPAALDASSQRSTESYSVRSSATDREGHDPARATTRLRSRPSWRGRRASRRCRCRCRVGVA
jgi:hypothetical protein